MRLFLVITFLLFLNQGVADAQSTTERPNILWISTEDHNPAFGAYGDEYADTPNVDRLAEIGGICRPVTLFFIDSSFSGSF